MLTEQQSHAIACYERRQATNRRCATTYYAAHTTRVLRRRLLARLAATGCVPSEATIARLDVDRQALVEAWTTFAAGQNELGKRAKRFHRQLVGSGWSPAQE